MREIKFRGKAIHNNEFVYGDLCHVQSCPQIIVNGSGWSDYFPVFDNTVGQFTGLYDKNGKEIYENDVLKHDSITFSGVVVWNSKGYFYIKEERILFPDEEPSCTPLGEMIEREDFAVIGNIHEKQNDEKD